jgi:hypothetical protein
MPQRVRDTIIPLLGHRAVVHLIPDLNILMANVFQNENLTLNFVAKM